MPRPHHVRLVEIAARRAESAARQKEARDAQRREHERERIAGEGPLIAELRHAGAAQEGADCERGPLRGLGQRVGGVQFLWGGDGRQNRRAPAGEKRRRQHQQRAQDVEQPGRVAFDGEDEAQRHDGADQVADDHDLFAIEAVERHSGERAGQHRGDGARQQDAAHHQSRARGGHRQAEDRDVIEMVADFAHHLPHPGVAIVAIAAQQRDKRLHRARSLRPEPLKTAPSRSRLGARF